MKYLSVCSGIEAATAAWHALGWQPTAFSEIEKFPSAVLAHHYPHVQNLGDMTNYKEWNIDQIDLLVGGTPCQSFSVAGLRKGLDDPRGNLCLVYLGLAARFQPRWILWENVPGVLSSGGGRDFGAFLGALAELGFGWAYRILDAQYLGVPQRRRRVFVVGYLGDWRRAAAVLFERHSLSGNPPPRREKREETAGDVAACLRSGGNGGGEHLVAGTFQQNSMDGRGSLGWAPGPDQVLRPVKPQSDSQFLVMAHGQGHAEVRSDGSPSLTCNHEAPIICHGTQDPCIGDIAFALGRNTGQENAVCQVQWASGGGKLENPTMQALRAGAEHNYQFLRTGMQVRRLTPTECERLQGFPDDYTNIPWRNKPEAPDGPRYKALGNSMAVPCMKWLGERLQMVDNI
jgi:DNA (cytosine-5)-methyltransferase 1